MTLNASNRKPISRLILGLDPGSYHTGFSVIEKESAYVNKVLSYGVWNFSKKKNLAFRLADLTLNLEKLLQEYKVDTLVLENIFLGKSVKSAFVLGQVRGVCLSVLAKARQNMKILEYSPTHVKKYITGQGSCSKEKLREFLSKTYNLDFADMSLDASDAVAVALCGVKKDVATEKIFRV